MEFDNLLYFIDIFNSDELYKEFEKMKDNNIEKFDKIKNINLLMNNDIKNEDSKIFKLTKHDFTNELLEKIDFENDEKIEEKYNSLKNIINQLKDVNEMKNKIDILIKEFEQINKLTKINELNKNQIKQLKDINEMKSKIRKLNKNQIISIAAANKLNNCSQFLNKIEKMKKEIYNLKISLLLIIVSVIILVLLNLFN